MVSNAILDESSFNRTLKRMAHEIIECQAKDHAAAIIGIQRRGVVIAKRLREYIREIEGVEIPFGLLDITFYRDDLSLLTDHPVINGTDIPFDITDKQLILVDDVLYTGRTIRAAMDAIFELGRPKFIRLAVVMDRGHRELPIRADIVGKNIPTSYDQHVVVKVSEFDGIDGVYLTS